MDILVPAILIFMVSVVVIQLLFYAYGTVKHPDRSRIRRKLKSISSTERGKGAADSSIVRKRVLSEVPLLNRILLGITGIERVERLKHQANTRYPVGFFVLLAIVLLSAGFFGCYWITGSSALAWIVAAFLGSLPFLYLLAKKQRRMKKFEMQLPEGLDMIARSMKAGHAFTTGMRLAADEFDDPLGTELNYTLDEINFGVSVPDALRNLVHRVDCHDLNFFAVSVILQRETGGNLAEIIESIAHLIRERFKLLGKIKALSAEGKISAIILAAIPFVVVIAIYFLHPKYIMTLVREPAGRVMSIVGLSLMILGGFVMRKITKIKV